jgi:DNA primase
MGGRISDTSIQDVRDRVNLVDLVSERTALRKRGRSHLGLCPFHAENTPSFSVSEERGFFHCFGCGASGDAFAWVMRMEQLSFPEAVRHLAARVGVELPADVGAAPRGRREEEVAWQLNEDVAACYQRALWDPRAGAVAREYLATRGIDEALARRWELGYAPGVGDALVRWLRAHTKPVEVALAVGLVGRRADGSLFDRFRARLMFPIRDAKGAVAGFGGRTLPGAPDDAPKYLNSSESPLFKKGRLVYGLHQARDAIRTAERAVLVEGYLDVLALHQHGVPTAVAPLGTALTADQLRTLRRYTDDIVACFDGDEAGARAAGRAFAVFVEAGLWGRAAFLPAGEDPDTYVRAQGAAAFERVLAEARPLLDVFLERLLPAGDRSVSRRVEAAREVGRLLRRVRNPWEYDVLSRRAAERLGVREEHLRAEGRPAASPAAGAAHVAGDRGSTPRPRAAGEALLVELMFTWPEAIERVVEEGGAALFDNPAWRDLAQAIIDGVRMGQDPTMLVERLPEERRTRVAATLLREDESPPDQEQLFLDCLTYIRRRRDRGRVREALEEIRAAEAAGDEARIRQGLRQWRALVETSQAEQRGVSEPQDG